MKICTKCKKEKKLEDFYVNNAAKDKKTTKCKSCTKSYLDNRYAVRLIKSFKQENQIHKRNILGEIIRTARVKSKMSQLKLAELTNCSVGSVMRLETGQGGGLKLFYRLLKVLNPELIISVNIVDYGDVESNSDCNSHDIIISKVNISS